MKIKLIIALVIFFMPIAFIYGDGGFFFEGYTAEAEHAQQALIIYNNELGRERLYLSVALSNDNPTNACWLIATPDLPEFEEMSNMNSFTALKSRSDPQFYYYNYSADYYDDGWGCGCYSLGDTGNLDEPQNSEYTVDIWYSFTNANYSTIIFSSGDTNVYDWLTNEGYAIPGGYQPILDQYTIDGWYFTAIKLDGFSNNYTIPVRLEFDSDAPIFPLAISKANSGAYQDIQILVLNTSRVTTSNYSILSVPIEDIEFIPSDSMDESYGYYDYTSGDWNYYEVLNSEASNNGYNALFLEHVEQIYLSDMQNMIMGYQDLSVEEMDAVIRELTFTEDPIWLTRFYARLSPDNMRDISFQPTNNISYLIYKSIEIYDGETNYYYDGSDMYAKMIFRKMMLAAAEMSIIIVPIGYFILRKKKPKKDETDEEDA